MARLVLQAITIVAIPTLVFVGGVWIMTKISGREIVKQLLRKADCADQQPLNQRLSYDTGAVERHWGALNDPTHRAEAFGAEKRFLELDLAFPLLYGGAFALSLFMVWAALDRPFNFAWLLAPVLLTVLADWTENAVQLGQMKAYLAGGADALQPDWIRVASLATLLKLVSFFATSLALLLLVGGMLVCKSRSE